MRWFEQGCQNTNRGRLPCAIRTEEIVLPDIEFQPGTGNRPPVANPDSITVAEGATATALDGGATTVLDNDTNPDPGDTLAVNTTPAAAPQFGVLVLNGDGTFSYTHDGSENVSDNLT